MQTPVELVAVLVSGLMLFIGLLRWVVNFMKGYEKRRLELFDKYEAALTENVQLKGQLEVTKFKQSETEKAQKYYIREYQRYKNLYEATLDKKDTQE